MNLYYQNKTPLKTRTESGGVWVLMFRQTLSVGSENTDVWPKNALTLNVDNPDSPNYAILDKIEEYRSADDNKLEFQLIWPNTNLQRQHWKQISNPIDKNSSGNVIGYEDVNINYTMNSWGGIEWTGLHSHHGKNDGVENRDCMINGSSKSDYYWFYTIGSYIPWNNGIPGPNTMVNQTELWILAWKFDSKGEAYLQYFLTNLGLPKKSTQGWLSTIVNKDIYDALSVAPFFIQFASILKNEKTSNYSIAGQINVTTKKC